MQAREIMVTRTTVVRGIIDARAQKITRAYWEPVMRREYEVSSKYLKSFVNTSAQKRSTVLE